MRQVVEDEGVLGELLDAHAPAPGEAMARRHQRVRRGLRDLLGEQRIGQVHAVHQGDLAAPVQQGGLQFLGLALHRLQPHAGVAGGELGEEPRQYERREGEEAADGELAGEGGAQPWAVSTSSSACARRFLDSWRKRAPAAVSERPLAWCRISSWTPSARSSWATAVETADCDTRRRRAAEVMLPVSAAAAK
nr:hypothetical protein [Phaeacidiphilus oryzae]